MTNEDPTDPTERLLARGKLSGPRMDRLWDRVAPQVVVAPARRKAWMWVALGGLPLVSALAVVALTVRTTPTAAPVARGVGGPVPMLVATCGTEEQPCVVGHPVHLKVMPRHVVGFVTVRLLEPGGPVPVAGPLEVQEGAVVPVPARVVPSLQDAAGGVDLEVVWTPQKSEATAGEPDVLRSVLHLHVVEEP